MFKLSKLWEQRDQFDDDSKIIIDNMRFEERLIGEIREMKKGEGWKVLETEIKRQLHMAISRRIKDDKTIQSLMEILHVTDEEKRQEQLDKLIDGYIA